MTNVFDIVFHHDEAVDTAAKGKTSVLVGINIRSLQYRRMDHAAAD